MTAAELRQETAEAIYREIVRWNLASVEPTHIVMAWDVLEQIARETPGDIPISHELVRVWGFPVILGPTLPSGMWFVGTDKPIDADRIRSL